MKFILKSNIDNNTYDFYLENDIRINNNTYDFYLENDKINIIKEKSSYLYGLIESMMEHNCESFEIDLQYNLIEIFCNIFGNHDSKNDLIEKIGKWPYLFLRCKMADLFSINDNELIRHCNETIMNDNIINYVNDFNKYIQYTTAKYLKNTIDQYSNDMKYKNIDDISPSVLSLWFMFDCIVNLSNGSIIEKIFSISNIALMEIHFPSMEIYNLLCKYNSYVNDCNEKFIECEKNAIIEFLTFNQNVIIRRKVVTKKLAMILVKIDCDNFLRIPPKYQYEDLCFFAVQKNVENFKHVAKKTDKLCYETVSKNPLMLEYVENQNEDLCIIAIEKDLYSINFVVNQTEKILNIVLQRIKEYNDAKIINMGSSHSYRPSPPWQSILKSIKNPTIDFCLECYRIFGYEL
jgi:hypothetical protein